MEQVKKARQVRPKANVAAVDLASRIQAAAMTLLAEGYAQSLWDYFGRIDPAAIANQRVTKDKLPQRLRAAAEQPQIITVQGRGERKGGTYLIVPMETVAEALEAQVEDREFVPITQLLRRIGGDVKIPEMAPRRSNWQQRQEPVEMVEPEVEKLVDRD